MVVLNREPQVDSTYLELKFKKSYHYTRQEKCINHIASYYKLYSKLKGAHTTIDMAEGPDSIMQIPRQEFLSRWLHREVLCRNST